eukprot:scaffold11.g3948.t1
MATVLAQPPSRSYQDTLALLLRREPERAAGLAAGASSAASSEHGQEEQRQEEQERRPAEQGGSWWGGLHPELVSLLVHAAGCGPLFALVLGQVCSGWRRAVAGDPALLRRLRFAALGLRVHADPASPLPALVERAAAAGNVSAAVLAARHLERAVARLRQPAAAAAACQAERLWARAAKLGHPEGQCRVGLNCYKGVNGQGLDSEQAMLWLSRACKKLSECLGLGADSATAAAAPQRRSRGRPADEEGPEGAAALPPLMTKADCRRLLSQTAHALAYCYFDGEACREDRPAAIRHFQLAAAAGCCDAALALGSLLKSGQYA